MSSSMGRTILDYTIGHIKFMFQTTSHLYAIYKWDKPMLTCGLKNGSCPTSQERSHPPQQPSPFRSLGLLNSTKLAGRHIWASLK